MRFGRILCQARETILLHLIPFLSGWTLEKKTYLELVENRATISREQQRGISGDRSAMRMRTRSSGSHSRVMPWLDAGNEKKVESVSKRRLEKDEGKKSADHPSKLMTVDTAGLLSSSGAAEFSGRFSA